ncbi:hypothetical protein [Stagnihabitans tardus]|uniref:Uncharacterized protein n=1 Tax=Stagnihabitans tardus TaxID=2699202 RepID=A0AAE4YEC1_9RHOB|nr:hypothetical protein [Stagnihabitans tardus]NBZ89768.1 hypothetical protein [Stagnihabitans tardus]
MGLRIREGDHRSRVAVTDPQEMVICHRRIGGRELEALFGQRLQEGILRPGACDPISGPLAIAAAVVHKGRPF